MNNCNCMGTADSEAWVGALPERLIEDIMHG